MSTPTTHDRQALLTVSNQPDVILPKHHNKYCKSMIISFVICLILTMTAIFLFVIYDVFDLGRAPKHSPKPGMIGLWPTYGGSLQNQQKPPSTTKVHITAHNVKDLKIECIYNSPNGSASTGYPSIDNDNNAYFADLSGYITSINLDNCEVGWRSHIGTLLGYNNESMKVLTYQSLTLFEDSNGDKGALFAAPQSRWTRYGSSYPDNLGCYAIAVHLNNGTLFWRTDLSELSQNNNALNYQCGSHGFYVDGKYAFGGMTQSALYDATIDSKFIGRYLKIDIDSHQIVNQWYPFNVNLTQHDEYNMSYIGIAAYNFPAMIDDYLVFGTGNLYRTPKYIDDCLTYGQYNNHSSTNPFLPLNRSHYTDLCGNDQSNNRFWRCLEKNVFVDSLIILNKTDLSMIHGIPLQGVDVYYQPGMECKFNPSYSPFCPSPGNQGNNADLAAVATFRNKENGKLYVVASQKSARLHIFELESGKLVLSKKYGPASENGQFNMAIDEDTMIGITAITGQSLFGALPRYKLANNMTVCDGTGSVHAFDMNTGNTLWQIVNPYGTINESKCHNDSNYEYIDYTIATTCEHGKFLSASETAFDRVIIPPKSNKTMIPILSKSRALFRAPVTIANNMVFVLSSTGDIWVHHLLNGSFIHHFSCPNKLINSTTNQWNRAGIKGGISVVQDRVVFYCGIYFETQFGEGNQFVSMKLQS